MEMCPTQDRRVVSSNPGHCKSLAAILFSDNPYAHSICPIPTQVLPVKSHSNSELKVKYPENELTEKMLCYVEISFLNNLN